ncbi:peptidoglycan-binding domain-containing protein [Trichothermofontia sp.]
MENNLRGGDQMRGRGGRIPHRRWYGGILGGLAIVMVLTPVAYGQSPGVANPASGNPSPEGMEPLVQRATLQGGSEGADVLELQATLKLLGFYQGEVSGRYDDPTAAAVAQFQQTVGLPADGVMNAASWRRLFPTTTSLSPALAASGTPQVAPVPASAANPPSSKSPADPLEREAAPATLSTPGGSGGEATTVQAETAPSATPAAAASPTPETATVAATTVPQPIDLPILRQGMHGPAVVRLQERLRTIGVFTGAIDGVFGAETQAAVKAAQTKFQVDPDGIVGPVTWAVLLQ